MPTEATLWRWLSQARRALARPADLHLERLENMVGVGHPDVEGCYQGVQFWLELKVAKRPARNTTKLRFGSPLRDSQVEWAKKRIAAGGRVWYLIQIGAAQDRQVYLIRATSHDIDALYSHVNEDWLRERDWLDDATPAGVVRTAAFK
jgi:hypothetical protein